MNGSSIGRAVFAAPTSFFDGLMTVVIMVFALYFVETWMEKFGLYGHQWTAVCLSIIVGVALKCVSQWARTSNTPAAKATREVSRSF